MDVNDPNFPIPVKKLKDHGFPFCTSIHYQEHAAGRLKFTKIRNRNFVLRKDGDAWLNTYVHPPSEFDTETHAPKVNGTAGDIALKVAEQKLKELGAAVAEGLVARALVTERLSAAAARAGLKVNTETEHHAT
jgi:hypothetical protein